MPGISGFTPKGGFPDTDGTPIHRSSDMVSMIKSMDISKTEPSPAGMFRIPVRLSSIMHRIFQQPMDQQWVFLWFSNKL
jgi:hypothetical protein